jgi:hypothetical protein
MLATSWQAVALLLQRFVPQAGRHVTYVCANDQNGCWRLFFRVAPIKVARRYLKSMRARSTL